VTTTLASPPQAATIDLDTYRSVRRWRTGAVTGLPPRVSRADPLASRCSIPRITCAETAAGSRFRSSTETCPRARISLTDHGAPHPTLARADRTPITTPQAQRL